MTTAGCNCLLVHYSYQRINYLSSLPNTAQEPLCFLSSSVPTLSHMSHLDPETVAGDTAYSLCASLYWFHCKLFFTEMTQWRARLEGSASSTWLGLEEVNKALTEGVYARMNYQAILVINHTFPHPPQSSFSSHMLFLICLNREFKFLLWCSATNGWGPIPTLQSKRKISHLQSWFWYPIYSKNRIKMTH